MVVTVLVNDLTASIAAYRQGLKATDSDTHCQLYHTPMCVNRKRLIGNYHSKHFMGELISDPDNLLTCYQHDMMRPSYLEYCTRCHMNTTRGGPFYSETFKLIRIFKCALAHAVGVI